MRTFHTFFLITFALFLGGIAVAQQSGSGPAAAEGPPAPCDLPPKPAVPQAAEGATLPGVLAPKARIKDLMNSMMVPSSNAVWNAVATSTDATGLHESKPVTDDDWNQLYLYAVELTEVGNLLMVPGRERCVGGAIPAQYRADFNQKARELLEAANVALIAAKKHDSDAVAEAGERIDVSCDACHEKYQIVKDDPDNYKKVLGTYKLTAADRAAAGAAAAKAKPAAAGVAVAPAPKSQVAAPAPKK